MTSTVSTTSAQHLTGPAARIDPRTTLGTVRLTVNDLARSRAFYEDALGLTAQERDDGAVAFGVAGEGDLARDVETGEIAWRN